MFPVFWKYEKNWFMRSRSIIRYIMILNRLTEEKPNIKYVFATHTVWHQHRKPQFIDDHQGGLSSCQKKVIKFCLQRMELFSKTKEKIATKIQQRDGWALLMIEQDTQEERETDDFEDFGCQEGVNCFKTWNEPSRTIHMSHSHPQPNPTPIQLFHLSNA